MTNLETRVIRTRRKTMSLEISDDLKILVRAPKHINEEQVTEFIAKNELWLKKRLTKKILEKKKLKSFKKMLKKDLLACKSSSQEMIDKLLEPLAGEMGVRYKKFRLSNAKKRWGSCNARSSINLSWKLVFAPVNVVRYVLVHELCHIKHLNHSKAFWQEVEKHKPDYKNCQKWLRENNYLLSL